MDLYKAVREKGVVVLLAALVVILVFLHLTRSVIRYAHPVETFPRWVGTPVEIDLPKILERKKLVALTQYSANSYFLFRGETMGFEYELLRLFAKNLGVELEIKTASTQDSLFMLLNRGEGDLIAADLTITRERAERVRFSTHHNTTRMVVVQKKTSNGALVVGSAVDLIGRTVSIREGSNYHLRIENLMQEIGGDIFIDTIADDYSTEDLISMVNDGEISYTIANENIARVNEELYPDLDMNVVISAPQRIAWAFRLNSPELTSAANRWMKELRRQNPSPYTEIYDRYYRSKNRAKTVQESEFYSLTTGTISPYDSLFRESGTKLFPWTLLTALAYQESRFDPTARSWTGALGLMQLLPGTISSMGESNGSNPQQSIRAAAKYLEHLRSEYWSNLPDSEAVKFTLASYNAGTSHILDAQRLAKELNLNPKKWDGNVEKAVLKLTDKKYYYNPVVKSGYCRCGETYRFVKQIIKRTRTYDQFIEEAQQTKLRDSLRISELKPQGTSVVKR